LQKYVKDIKRKYDDKLLTIEEEYECSKIILYSNQPNEVKQKYIDKLVGHNLRFVMQVAKVYMGKGLPYPDLISAGNIGMIIAASRYDYKFETKFITHAVHQIRAEIIMALSEQVRTVKIPHNIKADYDAYKKVKNKLLVLNGIATVYDIAKEMEVHIDTVLDIERYTQYGVSFDDPVKSDDSENTSRIDLFQPDTSTDTNKLDTDDTKMLLFEAIHKLDLIEQQILLDYYGIDRDFPISISGLAEKYNKSNPTISSIIELSIMQLKHLIRKE
jgi:RNA polymerase primary sigma factor